MLNGAVEILYWEAQPLRLGKPSAGHVALLITPSEPQDFSDISFPQMRTVPGKLYISFYTEGGYRAYHHDTDPSAGNHGCPPDRRITLHHLDVGAMLDKIRVLLSRRPNYSLFASTVRLFTYNREVPADRYNCVSFVLELLFAGGIGQYIPASSALRRIGSHLKSWMPNNALSWFAVISMLVAPVGYFWWYRALKANEILENGPDISHMIKFGNIPILKVTNADLKEFNKATAVQMARAPKGLTLLFANMYNYSPALFIIAILLACGALAYQIPVMIDGIKKVFITSPTDVYELVSDVALRGGPAQLSSLASSSSSSSSLDASHATTSSYAEPTSSSVQLPIPSVSAHQSSSIFGKTSSSTYFLHGETSLNPFAEDSLPLQSTTWRMTCGLL